MNGRTEGDIGFLLNKATRYFRLRLAVALGPLGLTPAQAATVMALERSPGCRLTPRAIAEAIGTDQATVSGLLDRLTRDGWVVCHSNPEDGRSRLVGLTPRATAALPHMVRAADAVSREAISCLTADEAAILSALLGRLCDPRPAEAGHEKEGER